MRREGGKTGRREGRTFARWAAIAALLPVFPPSRLPAQVPAPGDLSGMVLDDAGRPVPLALVTASADTTYRFFTDTAGRFEQYRLGRGVYALAVTKPGFALAVYDALVFPGERPDVDVRLTRGTSGSRPRSMSFAASGFEERRQNHLTSDGTGWYLIASDIAPRRVTRATQLLEGVPGLELKRDGQGVVSPWGANGTCLVPIFIDGVEARGIYRPRVESNGASYRTVYDGPGLDAFVRPSDIQAMEYHEIVSWIPAQYRSQSTAACGPLAIWTNQS